MVRFIISSLVILATSLFYAVTAPAQERQNLAELIPADAVAAIYWAGMNDKAPGYADSKLKAMLTDTGLGQRINDAVVAGLEPVARRDVEARALLDAWRDLGGAVWQREWVVFVQGVTFSAPINDYGMEAAVVIDGRVVKQAEARPVVQHRVPLPRVGFAIVPGEDAAAVRKHLTTQIDRMKEGIPGIEIELLDDGQRLGVLMGAAFAADADASLPAAEGFGIPGGQDPADAAVWVHVDLVAVDGLVRDGLQSGGDLDTLQRYEQVFDAMGLEGIDRLFLGGGFGDQGDWYQDLFVAAPAPRKRLLSLLDRPGLDGSAFALVPAASTWARATRFNLGRAWDTQVEAVRKLPDGEDADAEVDGAIASLNNELGFAVREDLIGSLGDTWVMYANPGFGGVFGTGVVLVHEPRDAAALDASLLKLQGVLNEALRDGGAGFTFNSLEQDGYTLHSMAAPFVSPAWAVADGRWYVGLTPQAVKVARAFAANGGRSMLDDPEFAAMGARPIGPEGPDEPASVMFTRLAESAPTLHGGWSTLAGFAAMAGVATSSDLSGLIPPLGTLTPHLGHAGAASWTDDAGYHARSISPFPGSSLLSQEFAYQWLTTGNLLTTPVWFAGMRDARDAARDATSMSNLRQVGLGLMVYAVDFDDQLPPDLGTVYAMRYLGQNPQVLFHPEDPAADEAELLVDADVPAFINKSSSYTFVLPGVKMSTIDKPSEAVMVVDTSGVSSRITVLYADGHVETKDDLDAVDQTVQEQTGKSLEQWRAAAE